MSVGEWCRKEVWSLEPSARAREAAERMAKHNTGFLVIVERGRAVGALSDRDLALGVLRNRLDPDALEVRELMRAPAVVIDEAASLTDALELMRRTEVRRLPVVDGDGAIVGLISVDDIARRLAGELGRLVAPLEAQQVDPPPSLAERQREAEVKQSE